MDIQKKLNRRVAAMLCEDTGAHMLDSGGSGGRHWQWNRSRDFPAEDAISVTVDSFGDVSVYLNLYHFMRTHLNLTKESEQLNRALHKFANYPKRKHEAWEDVLEAFFRHRGLTVTNHGLTDPDTLLDQPFAYWEFEHDDVDMVVIQVHGGCDLRGGYGSPQIFMIGDYFHCAMVDVTVFCTGHPDPFIADRERGQLLFLEVEAIEAKPCTAVFDSYDAGYSFHDIEDGRDVKGPIWRIKWDKETRESKVLCIQCGAPMDFFAMET